MNRIQLYYAIAQVSQKLSVFLLFFTVASLLEAQKYGLYSYTYTLVAAIAGIFSEAFMVGMAKFSSKGSNKQNHLYSYIYYLIFRCMFATSLLLVVGSVCAIYFMELNVGYSIVMSMIALLCALMLGPVLVASQVFSNAWNIGAFILVLNSIIIFLSTVAAAYFYESAEFVLITHGFVSLTLVILFYVSSQKYGCFARLSAAKYYDCSADLRVFIKQAVLSMFLNAPTHMLCVTLLMFSGGLEEVGVFNAFFIFYTAITLLPMILNMYAVKYLASNNRKETDSGFTAVELAYILCGGGVLCIILFLATMLSDWIVGQLGLSFQRDGVFYWVLISSCFGVFVILLNQVYYAREKPKEVFFGASIYSVFYLSLTLFFYIGAELTAINLYKVIALSALIQVIYLIYNIYFKRNGRNDIQI